MDDLVARLRAAGCVFAEDEARLLTAGARDAADLERMAGDRVTGTPLEYVLGWVEFHGMRIVVEPGVFVPRRRSELLVDAAAELHPAVVVELCCGAAAVATVLKSLLPQADVHAADIDATAVRCARRNLDRQVYQGDLYEPLPASLSGRVDVLVVNAPYVPTRAIELMPPEARDHEPRAALDGGTDGLEVQRRVAAGAARWLAPGGHLIIETSERQAPATADAFSAHGLVPHVRRSDELDGTAVIGRRGCG